MIQKKTTKHLVQERPSPEQLMKLSRTPILVVADNVRSLDNVGLLFRLCELARVEKLYLTGYTGYPRQAKDRRPEAVILRHNNRIAKTAVYAVDHQPWEYVADPVPLVQGFKQAGKQVLALEQTDQSVPYLKVPVTDYQLPVTLILGHERQGVRQELLELADIIVDIPILGLGNSHNVAVATGIILYHILEKAGKI
jgi:23S rRNA (guanosine2251-2'-O)-methyltransferase